MAETLGSWHPFKDDEDKEGSGLIVDFAFGFPNVPDEDPNLSPEARNKAAKRKFPYGRPRAFISILDPMEELDEDTLKVKGRNHPIATIKRAERFESVAFDFKKGLDRTDIGLTENVGSNVEIHYDGDDEIAGIALDNAIDLECEVGILGLQLVAKRYRRQIMEEEAVEIGKYGGYHDPVEYGSIRKMKVHVREKEDTSNDTN